LLSEINLSVEIAEIRLNNPIMTAAGPTARDGTSLKEAANGGAGGLVTKTISVIPAVVPRPCISSVNLYGRNLALLNCETWSDISYQKWITKEKQNFGKRYLKK